MARKLDPEVTGRIAVIKSLLCTGSTPQWVIEWCQVAQAEDKDRGVLAKAWTVSRQQARKYVDRALAELGDVDGLSKDRKRARNRGLHVMLLQRLLAKDTVEALRVAVKVADQICKIDGSYDPASVGGGAGIEPADDGEAAALIEHASATLELARSRGRMLAEARRPPVIDVEPGAEEPEAEEPAEQPGDAN